jgi:PAS domain S-box-containing protein
LQIAQNIQALPERSEDHLRLVIDTIPTMAWSLLPGGAVDFVNQRWLEYTGLSLEKALEESNRIVHPQDLPRVMEQWFADMAAGKSCEYEMRLRRADGQYRWFLVRTVPLRSKQGNIVKWYGTSTDIEDRKRAADALHESEEKFRQLAENIQEVFWMTTPGLEELLYVSPAYERIWGRSVESLRERPRSFIDAIHPDDREAVLRIFERQRERGVEVVYRIVRPDGSTRWIRNRSVPVKDESGKVYRIAGVAEDVTERKQMDEALRQSELDLAEAQRVARLGSWTFDAATGAVRWSDELYRIFDVERPAFGGAYEAFLSRVHPDDRTRVAQVNAEARSSGKAFEVEYSIETRDGRQKHIRELGYATKNGAGAVTGLFGIAQDITERKQAENALRASSVQLQALSRRLVDLQEFDRKELARELHDRIGQSLTALNINLSILGAALPLQASDALRSRLADSKALIESTAAAVGNILSDLRPPMLDDHGLALALDWYAGQISARIGVAVTVRSLGPGGRLAPEAEIALFRIAQEALNNVVKHARASRVEITLERSGSAYVMSVQDDGVGFDAVEGRTARRPGLGMVTMRERAEAVGGRFEVLTRLGGGTRLTVEVAA